ncbi:4Fe-4S dicluster domain-containing protein [Fusobacterium perfoetens]|uniref:4Fe-4S dicluster domain-containing protein n=1 Tax=Fusobacterium perfoetens TaxID=852 RepID=UPI000484E8E3|nr:4Fe-4S binding protein [Fusobacterium perfoetens]
MVNINIEKCIGCGKCIKVCFPRNIFLENGKAKIKRECMMCGHCLAICPVSAVTLPDYLSDNIQEYNEETFKITPENLLNFIKFRRSIRDYQQKEIEIEKLKNMPSNDPSLRWKDKWFEKYQEYKEKRPETDMFFFNASMIMLIIAEDELDGGLAASNAEKMAVAQGLGVLFSSFIKISLNHSNQINKFLGLKNKERIIACMLLGYPKNKYLRTVPRKEKELEIL